jgi:hypothetical protein
LAIHADAAKFTPAGTFDLGEGGSVQSQETEAENHRPLENLHAAYHTGKYI